MTVRQMPERGVRAPRCDRQRCCCPRCCPNLAARVVASRLSPANRPRRGPPGGRRVGCESGRPCRTRFGPRAGALASDPPRHVPSRIIGRASGAQQPTGCAGERVPTATSRPGGRPRQDPFGRQGQQPKLLTTRRPRRHPTFWACGPRPMCTRCHPRALPWQAPWLPERDAGMVTRRHPLGGRRAVGYVGLVADRPLRARVRGGTPGHYGRSGMVARRQQARHRRQVAAHVGRRGAHGDRRS